ncbi:MAG TPA: FtsW/RodA/SpoVE family cell cycle protein [Pyrinomonadaceae bacterium]|jgi:cell division protein FtsW (lipid II flippase)|nr:FtsW/RodA/SpoVE family cell cycle protein [Pyrinomonadaceae bacterium]
MPKLLLIARALIIFAFFFVPLLVYLLRRVKADSKIDRAPVFGILIALISAATLFGIVNFSKQWPEATQVVWTGVESEPNGLSVGGARENAIVGWPNGSFKPSLRAVSIANNVATLELADGGAFVWDERNKKFIGGTQLSAGAEQTVDGYRLRTTSELQAKLGNIFVTVAEVISQQGEKLARFNLPLANPAHTRVLPLRSLVEADGANSAADAQRLMVVGKWAADKRLLITSSGETRVLGSDPFRLKCTVPCDLTLHWVGQRLSLRISGSESRMTLTFLPPWRTASPLPPDTNSGERQFTLTATPRPDDVAFVLPLGHLINDHRPILKFGKDAEGRPVFTGPEAILGSGPPRPTYLPSDVEQAPNPEEFAANVTSQTSVLFDRTVFHFATVNDLPSPTGIAMLLALALVTYVVGVLLIGVRSPDPITRWVIYGMSACLWNLLVFRLLLALRFALDPSHLDDLAVKGVTLALTALAVVPGLILLWARLRADLNARLLAFAAPDNAAGTKPISGHVTPGYVRAVLYLVILIVVFVLEFSLAPHLWSNPPATPSVRLVAPFVLLAVYLFLVINCVHLSYVPSLRRSLRLLFIVPLRFEAVIARRAKSLWSQFAHEPEGRRMSPLLWFGAGAVSILAVVAAALLQPTHGWFGKISTVLLLGIAAVAMLCLFGTLVRRSFGRLVAASVIFVLLPFLARALPAAVREIVQEVIALFVLCLVPSLFWLSLGLIRRRSGVAIDWRRLVFLAVTMVVLPVFVMPKFLGDMGSAFATIPLFAIVAAILCLTPQWRAATAIIGALLCGVLLAGVTYRYFSAWLPGAAEVRLISYWQGSEIERLIPWARATRGGEGLSLQSLRDAYQHGWESRAIAREGDWFGVGYGNAPTRLSQVRADTIEFDSLYSFFVAGEHGLVGGMSLLLLFAMPLLLVFAGAWRTRTDFGYAGAALICAWLFLEAVLHAGMNLGTFPFTGRGMPLVNVNSTSDLLRWLILFGFAMQLLQWRDADGDTERTIDETASITKAEDEGKQTTNPAEKKVSDIPQRTAIATLPLRWSPRSRRALTAATLMLVPLLVLGVSHSRLILNSNFPRTFEWAGLLERIRDMIRGEVLAVNQQSRTIEPDWHKLPEDFNVPDGALIKQEILRFNALPLDERLDEQTTNDYRSRLGTISSAAEYDQLLEDLRTESLNRRRDTHPTLFRLLPPERQTDGITVHEVGGYRLTTNSAFNARFSFRAGMSRDEIPRVTFSDGQTLIGPAWVGGRWIVAFAPEPSIPWTLQLARTLTVEQNCFGRERSPTCQATLTLDRTLHEAATRFVSTKGRKAYEDLLREEPRSATAPTTLPPRVALAMLGLPDGEALVLGGYPRMTSSLYWQHASGSGDWLPPAQWVEQQAPDALRALYGGDRNFDSIVVGSATKPLWAAATLAVHPRLNESLRVKGSSATESDVFGIQLTSGWHVTPRTDWIDFTQYLTLSDNRYHIRLGFLGLAETDGGDVRPAGDSSSVSESIRIGGKPSPWQKYPQFSPSLLFSQRNPNAIANIERTPLASHLERMFAINPGGKPLGTRVSFWTKDELDDRRAVAPTPVSGNANEGQGSPTTAGFVSISPSAPNLRLDGITNPRDFVSVLLGGRTNLWSNIDLAAAFATSVTGRPLAAHIIRDERSFHYLDERESFPQTAQKLRPGLAAVVQNGTFAAALLDSRYDRKSGAQAFTVLNNIARNYNVYAKTGTLQTVPDITGHARYTSRVVLAIVRWDSSRQTVGSGVVFSLVVEMAEEGTASRWLGQFIVENEANIRRILQAQETKTRQ